MLQILKNVHGFVTVAPHHLIRTEKQFDTALELYVQQKVLMLFRKKKILLAGDGVTLI